MAKNDFFDKLKKLFSINRNFNEEFFEELGDQLVEGDLGAMQAFALIDELKNEAKKRGLETTDAIRLLLKEIMLKVFAEIDIPKKVKNLSFNQSNLLLILGVNGVGKTTSCAKLASAFKAEGYTPILAAADTFRAAAIEQLKIHGERLQMRVIAHKHGGDPAAVIYDALEAANTKTGALVIADTAGRMHTKKSLVEEIKKIDRIASSKIMPENYLKYLVLDATSGRNALEQAMVFNEALEVDGVILTKYDSSAKGGVAWSLAKELKLPILWIGDGEDYKDLHAFEAERYINEFLHIE